jgi:hypothetical protein
MRIGLSSVQRPLAQMVALAWTSQSLLATTLGSELAVTKPDLETAMRTVTTGSFGVCSVNEAT